MPAVGWSADIAPPEWFNPTMKREALPARLPDQRADAARTMPTFSGSRSRKAPGWNQSGTPGTLTCVTSVVDGAHVLADDEDFSTFVVARYQTLVRAAVLFGCQRQDAEDAVQDALLKCYAAWPKVAAADDRDSYVYRVLINGISRGWRRRWRSETPFREVPESCTVGDIAGEGSLSHSVRASLQRLRPQQRQVLVLRYFVDLSEAQIAAVLDIAPGTVKSRAARALAALSADESLYSLLATRSVEDQ